MKTVLALGCYDLLHVGHLNYLKEARKLVFKSGSDAQLIVGVASDEVVRRDKGKPPIIKQDDRVAMLNALSFVDAVYVYQRLSFVGLLDKIDPSVLAVGEHWGNEDRHKDAEEWMAHRNREVIKIPYYEGESTTAIRQRVIDEYKAREQRMLEP